MSILYYIQFNEVEGEEYKQFVKRKKKKYEYNIELIHCFMTLIKFSILLNGLVIFRNIIRSLL